MTTTKDRRREFRLATDDDDLLIEASALSGMTVTEFVLVRVLPDAQAIVEAHREVALSQSAHQRFLAALDAPMARNEALAAQARLARRLELVD